MVEPSEVFPRRVAMDRMEENDEVRPIGAPPPFLPPDPPF